MVSKDEWELYETAACAAASAAHPAAGLLATAFTKNETGARIVCDAVDAQKALATGGMSKVVERALGVPPLSEVGRVYHEEKRKRT